jgi:putative transposase
MQNGYVESFNGHMRDELLNESLFFGLDHARRLISAWVDDYNTMRPHSSLGYQTPTAFAESLRTAMDHHAAPRTGSARWSLAPVAPHGVSTAEALIAAG